MNPTIFEPALIIACKAQIPPRIVTIDGRQHTELRQKLKAVADPQHKAACAHEPYQPVDQSLSVDSGIPDAVGAGLCRAKVVAVQESAGEHYNLIRSRIDLALCQKIQMHKVNCIKSAQFQSAASFKLAVDAMTGGDQSLYFHVFPRNANGMPCD
jgi:hypothetical protein